MELDFKPHMGTDLLPFGTPRSEVRDVVLEGKRFVTRTSEPRNDFYVSDGLILGYDDQDTLEFIEVFSPSKATFDGIALTDKATKEVIGEFEKRGHQVPFDDGSYDFRELGIIFYCPEKRIESSSIYREGYYD
ncbi:hypothetical protein [Bremerella cremea]|uniref:hypothetical protein n=1 Tax=Bremerella cremea TaxID=1031537 RepID=UPI0031EA2E2E